MEANTQETKERNAKDVVKTEDTEGHNPKITSVVKEKIKDPRRVPQGKKLAAISREAKERKARERKAAIRKEEAARCEEEQQENFFNTSYALIPIIGIALGGYYFLFLRPTKDTAGTPQENRN